MPINPGAVIRRLCAADRRLAPRPSRYDGKGSGREAKPPVVPQQELSLSSSLTITSMEKAVAALVLGGISEPEARAWVKRKFLSEA
jgi:hypothetical protein